MPQQWHYPLIMVFVWIIPHTVHPCILEMNLFTMTDLLSRSDTSKILISHTIFLTHYLHALCSSGTIVSMCQNTEQHMQFLSGLLGNIQEATLLIQSSSTQAPPNLYCSCLITMATSDEIVLERCMCHHSYNQGSLNKSSYQHNTKIMFLHQHIQNAVFWTCKYITLYTFYCFEVVKY